jgi:hypothetical protein
VRIVRMRSLGRRVVETGMALIVHRETGPEHATQLTVAIEARL